MAPPENPARLSGGDDLGPVRSPFQTLSARLGGMVVDLLLLVLFLAAAVAGLEVLIRLVVLVVGYVQEPPADMIKRGIANWDVNRHASDWKALGLAVFAAVAGYWMFKGGLIARRYLLSRFIDASFESFISKRYLLSRQGGSLVSLITVVSVLGVSVGVMALIVVISVMNGFDRTLVSKMMGVFAHIEVWPYGYSEETEFNTVQYQRILAEAEAMPEVLGASPVISRQTFFQAKAGISETKVGGMIRGVDVKREEQVTKLTQNIITGTSEVGLREVVLGSELARKLGVLVGDEVFVFGGKLVATGRGPTGKISQMKVVGIFRTGMMDVDENFAYASIETVQKLSLADGRCSTVHIAVTNPDKVDEVRLRLQEKLGGTVYVRTWKEINQPFFEALWVEKVAMFIILLLIVLVAALNIVGTLIMVVTQKTREIGILKSMGATDFMVLRIFLSYGFIIGALGTLLGTAWGLWVCRFVDKDIDLIFQLPPSVYGLDRLPVVIEAPVIGMIALIALAICVTAGIIPSMSASRLNPVEALRYD